MRKPVFVAVSVLVLAMVVSAQTSYHAFLWSQSTGMQDLGSLSGSSYATGVNKSGEVVGYYISVTNQVRAFLWTSSGGMQDI